MTQIIFEELVKGTEVFTETLHLTRDSLVRYAGASLDFNPIHYRDDVAKSVGLPGVLAHGMLTMGVASAVATDWLGTSAVVTDYQTRFTKPVPVDAAEGASLTVTGTIGTVDEDARTARIDLKVTFEDRTVLGKTQLVASFR